MSKIIRMTGAELQRLLEPLVPHLPAGDDRPYLCQIPVAAVDGYLLGQATNRFTAAFQRVLLAIPPTPGTVFRLLREEARHLLWLLSDHEQAAEPLDLVRVAVVVEHDGAADINVEGLAGFPGGVVVSLSAPEATGITAKPQRMDTLLSTFAGPGNPSAVLRLHYLSLFAAAERHNGTTGSAAVTLPASPNQPISIEIGPDFLGLMMPVFRSSTAQDQPSPGDLDGWRVCLQEAHHTTETAVDTQTKVYRQTAGRR